MPDRVLDARPAGGSLDLLGPDENVMTAAPGWLTLGEALLERFADGSESVQDASEVRHRDLFRGPAHQAEAMTLAGQGSTDTQPDPWERQPRETGRRFAAFTVYRDMAASDRSASKVAQTLAVSRPLILRWSSAEAWVARVSAWDVEQDRIKRAARVKEIEDMGRRQAAAGALIQTKGLAKIRSLVDPIDRDGNPVELKAGQTYTTSLSTFEAVRLVEAGVRLERIGRGEVDSYRPRPWSVTNPVLQTSAGSFMHQNPTKIGAVVELLEQLATLMDSGGSEPRQVGPPLLDEAKVDDA